MHRIKPKLIIRKSLPNQLFLIATDSHSSLWRTPLMFFTSRFLLKVSSWFEVFPLQALSSISCISEQCILYIIRTCHSFLSTSLLTKKTNIFFNIQKRKKKKRRQTQKSKYYKPKETNRTQQNKTSAQEACIEKSLKQLITHCWISRPNASNVLTVDSNNPGLVAQQMSIRVSFSFLSTSNCVTNNNKASTISLTMAD